MKNKATKESISEIIKAYLCKKTIKDNIQLQKFRQGMLSEIEKLNWEKTKEYTLEEVREIIGWNYIVSFRKTEEGFLELTDEDGDKKIYSKDLKKELTEWFKEDYFVEDKKIFEIIKKEIGEIE